MRREIQSILAKLHKVRDKVEGYFYNAQELEYPDRERTEELEEELEYLDEAIDALENID